MSNKAGDDHMPGRLLAGTTRGVTDGDGRPAREADQRTAGTLPPHLEFGSGQGRAGGWSPGPEERRKAAITGRHRWFAGASVGLSFLIVAMVQAATSGGSVGSIVAFEITAAVFGMVYVFAPVWVAGGNAFASREGGLPAKVAAIATMLVLSAVMIALAGATVASMWIYIGVVGAILFEFRWAVAIAVVLAGGMLLLASMARLALPWELALTLVAMTLWMSGFVGNIRLTTELRDTREELARAAVAAERARIGRDLHDILGHSLTAIAVKAGLARRLISRDADAAIAEVSDVERLAREALADVRATAAGYRNVSLAAELAIARSVLQAAGIVAVVPTAVDDASPAARAAFGYVVREAVTNVVRHSGATRCVIELQPDELRISDDGRGGGPIGAGSEDRISGGLAGLAQRMAAVGGSLQAGPGEAGGFEVVARVGAAASDAAEAADPARHDSPSGSDSAPRENS